MVTNTRISKIVYPELSYKIVGILFEADNVFGYGHREFVYQKAMAELLRKHEISFKEKVSFDLLIEGHKATKLIADFVIDGRIVLEIKTLERITKEPVRQIIDYLHIGGYRLGILASFTRHGVIYRRYVL